MSIAQTVLGSIAGIAILGGFYIAVLAYWRWLGEQGEKRHAAEAFERDFIPEAADVAARERELLEAAIVAELDQADAERKRINGDVRAWLRS